MESEALSGRSRTSRFDHIWAKIANTDRSRRAVGRRSATTQHCLLSGRCTATLLASTAVSQTLPLASSIRYSVYGRQHQHRIDGTQSRRGKWRPSAAAALLISLP